MRHTFSIRETLFMIIALLNLLIASQTGLNAYHSWLNHRDATNVRESAKVINILYEVEKFLSLERGTSISVLYAEPAPSSSVLEELASHREQADREFSQAADLLNGYGDYNVESAMRKVQESYIRLRDIRYKLDSYANASVQPEQKSNNQKKQDAVNKSEISEELFVALTELIADVDVVIELYSRPLLRGTPYVVRPIRVMHLIWNITEYAGREYALLGRAIAEKRFLTRIEQEKIDNWRGRINYGWELSSAAIANSSWGDEMKPIIDEAQTHYLVNFEQIKSAFDQPQKGGGPASYPVSADMWLELAAQAVDSLHEMNDTVLKVNRDIIRDYKKEAERDIIFSLLLFAATLALSYYSWRLITNRVIRPVNSIANTLHKATHGEYYELPRISNNDDEIGKLVGVLQVFQQNSRELALERDRAKAANVAKSEFLANMSHEIRTPMNVVVGLANILGKSSPLNEKQKEYIHTLQLSAGSLLSLMNDLLDFSRIETQAFELEKTSFNLKTLLDEVTTLFNVKADEQNLTYRVDLSGIKNKKYIGDPTRIKQIMMNVCGNAFKFTEQGSITVKAEAQPSKNPGYEDVYISVIDTGIGIPSDKLDSIFEKFTQADSSITRKFGGTGLGLAIAKTFVEMMNGRITVDSTSGSGSTFTVYLPLPVKQ